MKLVLVGVGLCAVLFVVAVISPGASRALQGALHRVTGKGQEKSDRRAGRVGDWVSNSLKKIRRAGDESARAGRRVHGKLRERGDRSET